MLTSAHLVCYINSAESKRRQIMYICIKTNENMDLLVKTLLEANVSIEVSRHDTLSWIRAGLKAAGFLSYVCVGLFLYIAG